MGVFQQEQKSASAKFIIPEQNIVGLAITECSTKAECVEKFGSGWTCKNGVCVPIDSMDIPDVTITTPGKDGPSVGS